MARSQRRAYLKETGKIYRPYRKKRLNELGSDPTFTKISAKKVFVKRGVGGTAKRRLLTSDTANLFNPKTKSFEKAVIKIVVENPADRNLVRRNIMTKGTIIETDKGRAKITSRPGQDGVINAVLVS